MILGEDMWHKTNPFYLTWAWKKKRLEVLRLDKFECQHCKAKGFYKPANTVHHVNHLDKHPELALDIYYTDAEGKQKRNLISLCHDCHEIEHGYRQKEKKYLTEEMW